MCKLKARYVRCSQFMFTFAQDGHMPHMPRYDVLQGVPNKGRMTMYHT